MATYRCPRSSTAGFPPTRIHPQSPAGGLPKKTPKAMARRKPTAASVGSQVMQFVLLLRKFPRHRHAARQWLSSRVWLARQGGAAGRARLKLFMVNSCGGEPVAAIKQPRIEI